MNDGRVLAVSVGRPQAILHQGERVLTGIYKSPVAGRVTVGALGLAGDAQVDRRVHGGPEKAVYLYPHEHYAHWARELHRADFAFGQFGENLTTTGLLETAVRVGDEFQIGTVRLQVTRPREPCFKLVVKLNDVRFARPFLQSGRTGFYLRVVQGGELGAGDAIMPLASDPRQPTIHEMVQRLIKQ